MKRRRSPGTSRQDRRRGNSVITSRSTVRHHNQHGPWFENHILRARDSHGGASLPLIFGPITIAIGRTCLARSRGCGMTATIPARNMKRALRQNTQLALSPPCHVLNDSKLPAEYAPANYLGSSSHMVSNHAPPRLKHLLAAAKYCRSWKISARIRPDAIVVRAQA